MAQLLQEMLSEKEKRSKPFQEAIEKATEEKSEIEDATAKLLRQLNAEGKALDAEITEAERKRKFDVADTKIQAKKDVEEKIEDGKSEYSTKVEGLNVQIVQAEKRLKEISKKLFDEFFWPEASKGHQELEGVLSRMDERWTDLCEFARLGEVSIGVFSDKEKFGISMRWTKQLYERLMNWAAWGPISG